MTIVLLGAIFWIVILQNMPDSNILPFETEYHNFATDVTGSLTAIVPNATATEAAIENLRTEATETIEGVYSRGTISSIQQTATHLSGFCACDVRATATMRWLMENAPDAIPMLNQTSTALAETFHPTPTPNP